MAVGWDAFTLRGVFATGCDHERRVAKIKYFAYLTSIQELCRTYFLYSLFMMFIRTKVKLYNI
jgi:hypothetical protein